MAVEIHVRYDGDLHCTATHGPSGDRLLTDAPADNQGRAEHFSPTDLMAASLGTCVLTVMGIVARRQGWEMGGARAEVVKEMGAEPRRHIARLAVTIELPAALEATARTALERAAHGCPVQASLGPLTRVELSFHYR
ncbi:MAG TPA: OsmC family protein [Candidatus Polarisedimenticolaceae bacterium]|nr:OsmC family protein [Candidatus Polarisedimenticolaceae bacterium]